MPVASLNESLEEARTRLLRLGDRRDEIEREIESLGAILARNGVGMDERLTDDDDFPRDDVDVYRVRHARHRIICLQNDRKQITKEIEEGLHALHARQNPQLAEEEPVGPFRDLHVRQINEPHQQNGHHTETTNSDTIALVNFVSEGSPADQAGIRVDDRIVEFGSVNAANMKELGQIAQVVQSSVDRPIAIKILRGDSPQITQLTLTPRRWSGRGLLGCNIVPAVPPQ